MQGRIAPSILWADFARLGEEVRNVLEYAVDQVDLTLAMSVNTGLGGQGFIDSAPRKIEQARRGHCRPAGWAPRGTARLFRRLPKPAVRSKVGLGGLNVATPSFESQGVPTGQARHSRAGCLHGGPRR